MPGPADPVIDLALIRRLVDRQFPRWAGLPLRPVEVGGVDNRTFRLGEELSLRLPSTQRYAAQVPKEQRRLPYLAPRLPLRCHASSAHTRTAEWVGGGGMGPGVP